MDISKYIPSDLTVGSRVNVMGSHSADPRFRELTKVIERDGWLYWYWKPESLPDGSYDCGYSGIDLGAECWTWEED